MGRRGSGPGEFEGIRNPLVGPGDSLHVGDPLLRRVTVIGPDLSVGRVSTGPHLPTIVLSNGSYVISRQIPTSEAIGYPVHLVGPDGTLLRSFGADTPQYRVDIRRLTNRVVGPGPGETIWVAPPGRYVLERYDPRTGKKLARVVVRSSWFTESAAPRFDERLRPDPIIEGLWQQDPGFVWVLLRDADERWEPPAEANVMRSLTSHEYSRIYDWVLEAIDPEAGTVIAAKRFDDVLWFRPPTPLLTSRSRADTLNVTHNVWRADLMPKEVRTP
jgi:hypothetical protein